MKFLNKNWIGTTILACFLSLSYFGCVPTDPDTQHARTFKKMPKRDRVDKAMEFETRRTIDPATNRVPRERLTEATRIAIQRQTRRAAVPMTWAERGANNIGGRTRAIMYDPNDATGKKVWAGAVGGGLWYTNDITAATPTWNKVDDFWDNIAVTCITYDKNNTQTFYVGTGEGWFNADAIKGAGIWKTTDGGATWAQLSSTVGVFDYVQKVAVTNSGAVLAAIRREGFISTNVNSGGIYRSTNGGGTWTKMTQANMETRGADLEIAANNDIYATTAIFGSLQGRIWKSTAAQDGATWTDVTPAVTTQRRIEIACAPSDANTIYAVSDNGSGVVNWFKKSTNGGTSWTDITIPKYLEQTCAASVTDDFTRGQAWYDLIVAVDPTNANTVYAGGIDVNKSTNGGTSWTTISYWTGACKSEVHADQHAMVFKPGSSAEALFGNDGGIYRSTNLTAATPTFTTRSTNYNVTQYYAADLNPTAASNNMLAGAQDNGSHKFTAAGINAVTEVTGGDGAFCHIDQLAGNTQISSYVYNNYYITTNNWTSFTTRSFSSTAGQFINPTDFSDNTKYLYCGDAQSSFRRWLTTGGTSAVKSVAAFGAGEVTAVTVDPNSATDVVWFGISQYYNGTTGLYEGNPLVVKVSNPTVANPTGTAYSIPGVTGTQYVNNIEIERGNSNHLLVTVSNYGVNNVYESTDGGTSWTAVDGNLPDMPVRWAMFAPCNGDQALIATELGVWSTDNLNGASTDWQPSNTGLANVRTDMVKYRTSDQTVIAATHGRGVFTTSLMPTVTFTAASSNATEGYFSNGCSATSPNVKVINVPVSISRSVNATITVAASGGTATAGTDYSLQTTTMNFVAGGATTQNAVLWIIDDATNEGAETVTLTFTINTPGCISNGTTITHTFTINDDDPNPSTTSGSIVEIGLETKTAQVGVGQTAHFYSDNGYAMASVTHVSGSAPGCISVTIDRTGTAQNTQTNLNDILATNKTFIISSDVDCTYDVTLYYTNAELTVWGADKLALNIVKSQNDLGLQNAASTNTNTTIYPATSITTFGAANNIAYKGRFTSFSSFGLTNAPAGPLPVELLSFSATLTDNRYVQLDWATASESNNKGFEVERSLDGKNFNRIGFVAGKGNSSTRQNYGFKDSNLNAATLYYRLRQVDTDGNFAYSRAVSVNISRKAKSFYAVQPNPFREHVTLTFLENLRTPVKITIVDALGKQVATWTKEVEGQQIRLELSERDFPKGIYFLTAFIENEARQQTLKIVKE